MMRAWAAIRALVLLGLVGLPVGFARGDGSDPTSAGAYCPLPEPGQVPRCLDPARAQFGDFFEAVEAGKLEDGESQRLEAALGGSASPEEAYLALSSLAYGYFRLAQRAAADPEARPELTERLERWNRILVDAYADNRADPEFQQAVRRAAHDIDTKAPTGGPTSELLQQISQADGQSSGMRGALEGLIGRILGEEPRR
jgi:hypothetical protein